MLCDNYYFLSQLNILDVQMRHCVYDKQAVADEHYYNYLMVSEFIMF